MKEDFVILIRGQASRIIRNSMSRAIGSLFQNAEWQCHWKRKRNKRSSIFFLLDLARKFLVYQMYLEFHFYPNSNLEPKNGPENELSRSSFRERNGQISIYISASLKNLPGHSEQIEDIFRTVNVEGIKISITKGVHFHHCKCQPKSVFMDSRENGNKSTWKPEKNNVGFYLWICRFEVGG